MIKIIDPLTRFLKYVNKTDTCWFWIGTKNSSGYGIFSIRKKYSVAHKWLYEHTVSQVPDKLDLDHICRNRNCVNPDHLEPVTRSENSKRGIGPKLAAKRQLEKTHCPKGHEYSEENTYIRLNVGNRVCRICHRERERIRRQQLNKRKTNVI